MDKMVMQSPANMEASVWWRALASQFRDMAENDNCSPLDGARALREWAASRADSPEFASFVNAARADAAAVLAANRPKVA